MTTRLVVLLLLLSGSVSAQAFVAKVDAPLPDFDARFGHRVLLEGNLALVTERGAEDAGRVISYQRAGASWSLKDTLQPLDSGVGQLFGHALAFSNDVLVIGAPGDADATGAAYVAVHNGGGDFGPLVKLVAGDASRDRWFGSSVAIDGDTIVVGAPGPILSMGTSPVGAAYVFVRTGPTSWIEQARFDPDVPSFSSALGLGVALIDGGTLAFASDPIDSGGSFGGVFLYERDDLGTPDPLDDTWSPAGQLEAPVDSMGTALVAEGDTLLCSGQSSGFDFGGLIYAFERIGGTWTSTDVISNPLGGFLSGLGRQLSLSGDVLAAGDTIFSFGPPSSGTHAFVFTRSGTDWSHAATLQAPDETVVGDFGNSVSVDGTRVLAGAPGALSEDDWPSALGAFYEVDLGLSSGWDTTQLGFTHPGLAGWGSLSPGSPASVRIYSSDTFADLSGDSAFLIVGASAVNLPFKGSIMIPQPALILPLLLSAAGDLRLDAHWPAGVPSGAEIWMQAWTPPDGVFQPDWLASEGLRVTQP